ncbi:MAG TPA: hypothetical protein VMM78_05845, partial [Thermomicrobiales bacterium]|nr:hypothetical protein [Thermomicrobiales bacterium]
ERSSAMSQMFSEPMPQPGETGSSATITVEIVIDSYPSLIVGRNGHGEPLDAVQAAIDAALDELPDMVAELSDGIMQRYPVRMYLLEDDDDDEDE